ncbi:MAG TPA: PLP-dependent aspartate aminotransferase family protein [Chitinispirillaceae bacterium]|nr:PLP-dependent aspartate aminotransferase family protein [Chitinispirillaceae bacterium]
MKKKTDILHAAAARDKQTGALSIPVYHASTYHQSDIQKNQEWEYGRSGNPTRCELEKLLAALEGASGGFAFSSGMAALTTALTSFISNGDHIVAARDIYGGTYRLITTYLQKFGVTHTFVDTTDSDRVEKSIEKNSRILLLETPSNPLLKITDISAMVSIAKKYNLLTIIDNTFLTPYLFRPLDLGIDISVHSATKFLGGHSDLIAGAVMTKTPEQARAVKRIQNTCGNILSPNDSWLLIRGIKTLSARMDVQCRSAQTLAEWLSMQSWAKQVYYPGLKSHPGHQTIMSQAYGFGAVVSVKTDTVERAIQIMKNVKIWSVAVSLGGVESILSYPTMMSHAAIPALERQKLGISDNLIRLSVGLEDCTDLIEDLKTAAEFTD